jgi:hypothetical protein
VQRSKGIDEKLQAQRQTLDQLRKAYYGNQSMSAAEYVKRALYEDKRSLRASALSGATRERP